MISKRQSPDAIRNFNKFGLNPKNHDAALVLFFVPFGHLGWTVTIELFPNEDPGDRKVTVISEALQKDGTYTKP